MPNYSSLQVVIGRAIAKEEKRLNTLVQQQAEMYRDAFLSLLDEKDDGQYLLARHKRSPPKFCFLPYGYAKNCHIVGAVSMPFQNPPWNVQIMG